MAFDFLAAPPSSMGSPVELLSWLAGQALSEAHRPLRLHLAGGSTPLQGALMVQRFDAQEEICSAHCLSMQLLCVSTRADLPASMFLGLPVALQVVTDRGGLRSFNGVIVEAEPGQNDAGLQSWRLKAVDALGLMDAGCNSRVFRSASVLDITRTLLREWLSRSPALARAFDFDIEQLKLANLPQREFTLQWNESDSAFLIRLWRKHGIAWMVRPGRLKTPQPAGSPPDPTPGHTLVLFDDAMKLPRNDAGAIRYHRESPTEERDGITRWSPGRSVVPGELGRSSWDYKLARVATHELPTLAELGLHGRSLAQAIRDHRIDPPHWADSSEQHERLGTLQMLRHEMETACVRGASHGRDLASGTWLEVQDAPGTKGLAAADHQYVFTQLHHWGENNLPKELDERLRRLFEASGWPATGGEHRRDTTGPGAERRYGNSFTAVRRGTSIVPAFDARTDWPCMPTMTAIAVGSEGQEIECDDLGRIKIRILGLRAEDHVHAHGAGTNGNWDDSAWVRVMSPWASRYHGSISLPRVGDEVVLGFVQGDPDKPLVMGGVHNALHRTPSFNQRGQLPGNKYLSGTKSREVFGERYNQTRYDDTPGQISLQIASQHADSEVNLGYLTHPRTDGRAEPRGEGAEIRTDGALVARGGQGVLVTAEAQPQAGGELLSRDALLGLIQSLQTLHGFLGEQSAAHMAESTDGAKLGQIIGQLQSWAAGSNTDPEGSGATARAQAPMVAVTAPAGVAVASRDNLLLGAQSELDSVSVGNTQITAGKRLLLRCADLFSAFAQRGMKLIAATGKILLQTNQDDIQLTSARDILLAAGNRITLQAPNIRLVAQGAQIDLGGGSIVLQSSGPHVVKSSDFNHLGPGDGTPPGADLPSTRADHDQRVQLRDFNTEEPLAGQRYRVRFDDGRTVEGVTDAQGMTELLTSTTAFAPYTIEAVYD